MRKLIVSMMITIDGFFEGPNHELDWHLVDEEFNEYAKDMLNAADLLLFGRITYQLMASYWPTAKDNDPIITEKMNNLSKVVFSRTLTKVEWPNSSLIRDNIAEEIYKLKQQPGKDILVFGSATILSILLQNNLLDELRLIVNPIILGNGNHLFKNLKDKYKIQLLKTKNFNSGNVLLYYKMP